MKKEEFQPLVSIVIPVYNGENYVEEAIKSALNQTYKNLEIIVVNDGSQDNTDKIVKKYSDKIVYLKKENGGVASALNLAISKMKGEYFSWLSHDDLYFPYKIERQIQYLNELNKPNAILYSDYCLIDSKGKPFADCNKNHEELLKKSEYALLRGNLNGITVLIPKKAFEECGEFNLNLRCTQDYDMWFRMLQKKFEFIHQSQILAMTRIHSAQDSQISPHAEKEGNELWIRMMDAIDNETKLRLEGSFYLYYSSLAKFLKETPYKEAYEYAEKKSEKYYKDSTKNKVLVSVVIPFFNNESEVINAIKSVQEQTYKNIEIVLVDDCSTDNMEKLHGVIKKSKNIKYFKNKTNSGPAASRNFGFKNSNGKYVALLDSDDLFVKEKIHKQVMEMEATGFKFSYTNYIQKSDSDETLINSYTKISDENNELIYNCKIATPTVMVNKDWLIQNNILYNEQFKICEDACFYLECSKNTEFLFIEDSLTIVNVDDNTCQRDNNKRLVGIKNIINYVLNDEYYQNSDYELIQLFDGFKYFKNQDKEYIETYKENTPFLRRMWRTLPLSFRLFIKKVFKKD